MAFFYVGPHMAGWASLEGRPFACHGVRVTTYSLHSKVVTLGPEGGWIVMSHIGWGGKQTTIYKGVETWAPKRGWIWGWSHIDWRKEGEPASTLCPEGGWIVMSHIGWRGKQTTIYKGVETWVPNGGKQTIYRGVETWAPKGGGFGGGPTSIGGRKENQRGFGGGPTSIGGRKESQRVP